jgi:hypothetical protein
MQIAKHYRFFTARLWVRQVALPLFIWLQGVLTVFSESVFAFCETVVKIHRNYCSTKGIAAFLPPTPVGDEWVSAAIL